MAPRTTARELARLAICLLLIGGAEALQAAPRVDVLAVDLAPLIDRAAKAPSRFAVDIPHVASPATAGEWSTSGDLSTWTYLAQIPGAVSMSFHATQALLPPSATLTVSADGTPYVYTAKDAHGGELWSRIGRGDSLVFELSVATKDVDSVRLEIASLQAGYRSFGSGTRNHRRYDQIRAQAAAATESLPACAVNWSCEITPTNEGPGNATVALVIGNVGQCSGVLLNDVPGDGTPYVLTARHCENGDPDGGSPTAAASITVYWNAVSPCDGSLGSIYDPGIVTQYGAQTVVEQQDAWLIRLNQRPIFDAYYAGWDATGSSFVGGFTAHHALGSTRQFVGWFGQAAYFTVPAASLGVRYDSTFWGTVNAVGAGGPGASGAGVFDASGRLVGTLVRGVEQAGSGVCPVASPPAPSQSTATTFSTALSGIFSSTSDPASTTGTVTIQSVLDPGHTGTQTISGQKRPITVTFTNPSGGSAEAGRQALLSWTSAGAQSCTASGGESGDGWTGSVPTSGSKTVVSFDGGDVTYTLTCTDGQRTGSASTTLHWTLPTPSVALYGIGAAEFGAPFPLAWTSNVQPCAASGGTAGDGWTGTLTPNGGQSYVMVTENVVGLVTYTLTCGSGTRVASAQTSVNVTPPSVYIVADAVTLRTGQLVTITARGGGQPCARTGGGAGDGWAGSVADPMTITESTPGVYAYTMTCGSGSYIATDHVTVTFVSAPPAVSFRPSSPTGSVDNGQVVLSWDANVRPCLLSSNGPTSYHLQTGPLLPDGAWYTQEHFIGRYDYTLVCGSGADTAQATVTVDWTGTPSVSISAPSSAVRGSAFVIAYWANILPCTASGGEPGDHWTGQFPDTYPEVVTVVAQTAGTKTYTITCGSGGQTVTASASVDVLAAAPQVTLTPANSSSVTGVPITLTWSSNVSPCVLSGGRPGDGWTGSFGSSGSLTVTETLAGLYGYYIQCGTSLFAYATALVRYSDVPAPTLTASKTEVGVGESFTLTWASSDGSTCFATGGSGGDGWYGDRDASGSLDVRETLVGSVYFGLSCGQSLAASLQVKIDPPPPPPDPAPPPTVRLTASSTTAQVGDPITLTWTAANAQSCTAGGGSLNDGWTGSLDKNGGSMTFRETFAASYSYDVTCFGAGTNATATVNVTVTQAITAPPPAPSTGGGGGGAMGPVDVAFFLALFVSGLWQRRRLASIKQDRPSRTSA